MSLVNIINLFIQQEELIINKNEEYSFKEIPESIKNKNENIYLFKNLTMVFFAIFAIIMMFRFYKTNQCVEDLMSNLS